MVRAIIEKKGTYKDIPYLIAVNYMGHRCAYLDVSNTPFQKYANDENYDECPLSVHGGVTYGGQGVLKESGDFIGWDYAHCDDKTIEPDEIKEIFKDYPETVAMLNTAIEHNCYGNPFGEWENSLESVEKDVRDAIDELKEMEMTLPKEKVAKIKGEER